MDVLIDRRELLERARERKLNLQIVEKDYVLGWLLYALGRFDDLVFKGGTALAKIYFPQTWRLSEDLDFAFQGKSFESVATSLGGVFTDIRKISGIKFELKNVFSNPDYLQLKIRYDALIGRNWAKVDITREKALDTVQNKPLSRTFSDYPEFAVRVETIEEIFAQKLRSLLERTKSRDYYDVWKLCSTEFHIETVRKLFEKKCKLKDIEFTETNQIFPKDIFDILKPYWERELGRLVNPLPELKLVLTDLQSKLEFL